MARRCLLLVPDRSGRLRQCWAGLRGALQLGSDATSSYEHLGQGVGPGAGYVAFGGVERHVVDGLLELLPVRRELLDAGLALQVPQTDGAVVT